MRSAIERYHVRRDARIKKRLDECFKTFYDRRDAKLAVSIMRLL